LNSVSQRVKFLRTRLSVAVANCGAPYLEIISILPSHAVC
jgi:hypothetical protein